MKLQYVDPDDVDKFKSEFIEAVCYFELYLRA